MPDVRKARRLAIGIGAAAAALAALSVAPAEAEPPFATDVTAETDGALAAPVVLFPGEEHVFPTGGAGVCNPDGTVGTIAATVSADHGGGHGTLSAISYAAAPGDVWVEDGGAICGTLDLAVTGGEFMISPGAASGTFTLTGVTATLEIAGTGVFEQHIPAGCTLSLDFGALTGTLASEGPPNNGQLSADGVSIAEASADSCGPAYSHLLNVGFGLPASDASFAMDVSLAWEAEEPPGPDGAAVFADNCAVCHGANGEGNPALGAPALGGVVDEHGAAAVEQTIRTGVPPLMPAWEGQLTDAEITAVVEFVGTLEGEHNDEH